MYNPFSPEADPQLTVTDYQRTPEEVLLLLLQLLLLLLLQPIAAAMLQLQQLQLRL